MVRRLLHNGDVKDALRILTEMAEPFLGEGYNERIERCQEEFRYMGDFMMRGFQDPQREKLYGDLIHRLLDIFYDLRVRKGIIETPYIKGIRKILTSKESSVETLQTALLTAEGDKELHEVLVFCFLHVYISGQWTEEIREEWEIFLTSPKVSSLISATIVSAISLSLCKVYSPSKAMALANIFLKSNDEMVRQRAFAGCLIGSAYALDDNDATDGEILETRNVLKLLLGSDSSRQMLMEMQIQMNHCQNVDKDSSEISKTIMPNLMKNQPFKITKDGIVEREEESDILDPHASERKAEAMEASVRKMLDMQKAGSDIFFQGFSQMKRYPFFYKLPNWFMPFYMTHPDIRLAVGELPNNDFVERVTKLGPFCDSDKYSFVIAMASVMKQMPENVRKMMDSGEVGPIGMREEGTAPDAAFIRLRYLQDLYRFYRLNPFSTDFGNPFAGNMQWRLWVNCAEMLSDKERYEMCMYILKHAEKNQDCFGAIEGLLKHFSDRESYQYHFVNAEIAFLRNSYGEAQAHYKACLAINKDSRMAMRGMARVSYAVGEYAMAAYYYDALHTLYPERTSFLLNYIMAMVKMGDADSVLNEIYRLDYENPGDTTIQNTLAWTLLYARKPEKALAIYNKVLENPDNLNNFTLLINAVYAHLFCNNMEAAMSLLNDFSKQHPDTKELLHKSFTDDADLLQMYSFGQAEKAVILSRI